MLHSNNAKPKRNAKIKYTQVENGRCTRIPRTRKKSPVTAPLPPSKPEITYTYTRKTGTISVVHVVYPAFPLPPKNYGGVEKEVYLLAEEQAKRGYDVYVFAHPKSVIPGCTIIPYALSGQKQVDKVLYFIRNDKPDIIHDHSPWGLLGTFNCGCPVIRAVYGDPFKKFKHTIREDAITVFTTKAFAKFYGFPDAPIIRMAIEKDLDKTPFQPTERKDFALFVGKMEDIKGPQTAIKWAKKMERSLVLLGPVFKAEFFNAQIRKHLDYSASSVDNAVELACSIRNKIIYGGVLNQRNFWKPYLSAGVTLVPSQCEEAMSMVVQEAMLTGCPVIATDRGGIFESMGEGIGGRVVNSMDEAVEWSKTISEWYDPWAARNHILTTRTSKVMVDSCDKIYKEILK